MLGSEGQCGQAGVAVACSWLLLTLWLSGMLCSLMLTFPFPVRDRFAWVPTNAEVALGLGT